jgi:hypothetical protein
MRSATRGTPTSGAEVTNVSIHGLWVLVAGREHFIPFSEFPWFADAPIAKLSRVEFSPPDHLHWPDLDQDLSLESIDHPERFPLVSRVALPPRRAAKRRRAAPRGRRSPAADR